MNFETLRALVEGKRHEELVAALRDVDPLRRKELAVPLKEYERVERPDWGNYQRWTGFAVAGAGLLPNASSLAPWLVRNQMWPGDGARDAVDLVLEVLRHRDVPWLPDLGARLAARMLMREPRDDLYRLVAELCGDTPPDTDGFLIHLARRGPARFRPGYEVLVPRLLEVVGTGAALLRNEAWPPFLLTKADRSVLLDGCLARLQRGGTHTEMTGFLVLHEVIHPAAAEVAAHAKDYVAMLPDSRLPVATFAQSQLQRIDSLDFALLCDASRWAFSRDDKKLVRTQLAWLGSFAAERPDEVLLVAAELFAHPSADLRGRAVSLVHKHLAKVSEATRAEITALAEQLPADLAAKLGGSTSAPEQAVLVPFAPEAMPEPIASPDELCRELLPMFGRNAGHFDPVAVERVLEALVRFAWQDRDALRTASRPLFTKYPWLADSHRDQQAQAPYAQFQAVLSAAVAPPRPAGVLQRFKEWRDQFAEPGASSPSALLTCRLYEIATGLERSPRPALVSTPTSTSGLLDPGVLAARLARADTEGWLPWPDDLRQALRRLPRETEIAVSSDGKASRLLREWTGHSDPVVAVVERSYTPHVHYSGQRVVTEHRLLTTVTPGLPDPRPHWRGYDTWGAMLECWPALMPAQREVVAGHLVPHLAHRMTAKATEGPLLPALARTDGPIGAGMCLALAYGLSAQEPAGRAHAVDALLVLASRGQLDGTALGDIAGLLLKRGDLVVGRVVPPVRDVALSGAAQQVWDLLAAALPWAWGINRVADLLELAVEVAQLVRPGGEVRGLAEVAARKGSSRTVTEAKRLVVALNG